MRILLVLALAGCTQTEVGREPLSVSMSAECTPDRLYMQLQGVDEVTVTESALIVENPAK